MLPLWIIDITKQSDRRDAFKRLVGQIEHVFIADNTISDATDDEGLINSEVSSKEEFASNDISQIRELILEQEKNNLEEIVSEDKRRAARNARIEGNYWYYSCYEMEEFFKGDILKQDNISDIADCLYNFQEKMIDDAKDFVMTLRESNAKPYQPINIVVLGDVTEDLTQLVFPSIAAILQKEKGRFLSGHIHQGMSVIGMLYIPCNVNALEVGIREKILHLLQEIEVQHNISSVRGYDNMMLYQNVQNRTECTYKKLNDSELAAYMVQCLVHLYLACDINHPLLSGSGADDTFYFSMGATSAYFDLTVEDKSDANFVAVNLLKTFKEEGDHTKDEIEISLFDQDQLYSSSSFISHIHFENIDINIEDVLRAPRPHPIKDWLHRHLKRVYYQYYLRYFPAELLRCIMQTIEEETSDSIKKVYNQCATAFRSAEKALPVAITKVISKSNPNSGVLTFVEAKLKETEEYFSKQKKEVQRSIKNQYWNKLLENAGNNSSFEDYHDTYMNDIRVKNSGAGCNSMKQETLEQLKDLLSKEKTLMATAARCVLFGIVCVIGGFPILKFLSPDVLNLGDVVKFWPLWYLLLFCIPFLIQFVSFWLYQRKKRNLIHLLKTYYTHDAYARIANRMESEVVAFYNKMIELIGEYHKRCQEIRKEVNIITPDPDIKLLFPQTMFNQPLNGGEFCGEPMISKSEVERCRIKVNGKPEQVNHLTSEQYHILIHHFKDGFAKLFSGISITDSLARAYDEEAGDNVFIGRDKIIAAKQEQWQQTKIDFNMELRDYIRKSMCDRLFPTIGDKLLQYKAKTDRTDTLEFMIAMAATNGEFSSHSDTEYADVKANKDINEQVLQYLPTCTKTQFSEYDELYQRYLFITRWRVYNKLSFNRLLPKEDFDNTMREERVFEYEMTTKSKKRKEKGLPKLGTVNLPENITAAVTSSTETAAKVYRRCLSSLILWATCPDDNSSEWLKLFDVGFFNEAFRERLEFRKIMNKND